jgi:SanA protein
MRRVLVAWVKKSLLVLGVPLLLAGAGILAANLWVVNKTRGQIESDLLLCAAEPVGLVFGTSYWTRGGGRNPHYAARLEAASRLLRLHRVRHLLLSGDNRTRFYNEPVTMWRDLRAANVPDARMTLDYAGFSTFDTLIRAREVFDVDRALLITQGWHLPRALYIADALGIEARGCAIPTQPVAGTWRLEIREWLARVGMLGDLYLWHRQPHFLGPREPIEMAPF